MAEECCLPGGNIMLLACSGGSNVGQLANHAAVELTQEGFGKMYCLAGIGGLLDAFVQSAKDVLRWWRSMVVQRVAARRFSNTLKYPLNPISS